MLRGLLREILSRCGKVGSFKSVAMPFIGTGNHKFPKEVVFRAINDEVRGFSSKNTTTTLKEIRLIRYDEGRAVTKVQSSSVRG